MSSQPAKEQTVTKSIRERLDEAVEAVADYVVNMPAVKAANRTHAAHVSRSVLGEHFEQSI